ncbi:26s proteasome non-atpase regulatory subunit 12 [Lentinula edodes]|uniref:26s proteasome non-atpase regulatory subunit 12 n=1 Tax=Lentinula edodes TaxID=5353 RepID=A0A1Q3EAX9_LENED|nr:26s proteasome non-atpase regulatory subunit 12 [Lentinula edodes]
MKSPLILRDPDVTQKLLEAMIDTPGGKRTVSRLARTCRAISEPALNVLWRDLDSLIPIIGLFPATLLKKVRKPGLGLSKEPAEEDWTKIMRYGERVRSVLYNETANNVSPSIFPMLAQNRPREYMLPNLLHLTWKVETLSVLDYCAMFLNPTIESLQFELGPTRFPNLNKILGDACSRLNLTSFSIISPASLPDTFTVMLSSQKSLQKVVLVAPGALSSGVGRWIAFLPQLKSLQLDLSARTLTAVEGFFDELPSHSDFSEIRLKSAMRDSKAGFSSLRHIHLTGDVANIAVFLRHFSIPLTQLDLVIEDPPDNAEWMELSYLISERFGSSLHSLRISATATSKFNDLPLPALRRLDIDLPESINFIGDDIEALAHACPNLEELKLCPLARFPVQSGPPKLTLEQLAPRPSMVDESVEVHPELASVSIDATPRTTEIAVEAVVAVSDEFVEALPETVTASVDARPPSVSKSVEAMILNPLEGKKSIFHSSSHPLLFPVFSLISFTYRVFFAYPISIPIRMLHVIFDNMPTIIRRPPASTNSDISMDSLQDTENYIAINPCTKSENNAEEQFDGMPPAYEDDWLRHLFEVKFATRHLTHSVLASSTMSDNKKQEKDFTSEVDALLPETASLAKAGKLQEALDKLAVLEKQTRNNIATMLAILTL